MKQPWCKVRYLPEPFDCIEVTMQFPIAQEDHPPVCFALGPEEAKELCSKMFKAITEAAKQEKLCLNR